MFQSKKDNSLPVGYHSGLISLHEKNPFDSENEIFTYNINNKTWSETLAKLKENQIEEAKIFARTFLYNTDWYVVRKAEKGTAIPDDIEAQRDNIRITCDNHEAAINALNTKAEVVSYNIVY